MCFIAEIEASFLISSWKFNILAHSDSKYRDASPETLFWIEQVLSKFFILAKTLNDRSLLATGTDRVQHIRIRKISK